MDRGATSGRTDRSTGADRSPSERSTVASFRTQLASLADSQSVSLYRASVDESASRVERWAGLGAVGVAFLLGAGALSLFLWSGVQPVGTDTFWALRQWSFVAGMLAVPALASGVVSLLPAGRPTRLGTVGGDALCVLATGWFVLVYPFAWTAAGNDIPVTTLYLTGVAVLAVTTGSALFAGHVERTTVDAGHTATETEPANTAAEPDGAVGGDDDEKEEDPAAEWTWVPVGNE